MTKSNKFNLGTSYPELADYEDSSDLAMFVEQLEQYCTSNQPPEHLNQLSFKEFNKKANPNPTTMRRNSIIPLHIVFTGWKHKLLIGITGLLLIIGIIISMPQTREVMAGWFGFSVDQRTTSGFIISSNRAEWVTDPNASYNYNIIDITADRWNFSQKWPGATPTPGKRIPLPNGKILAVPSYLPEGYRWQTAALPQTNLTIVEPHFWSMSSWGGGGGLVPPNYDPDMVMYLVGGNKENSLLVVSQYDMNIGEGVIIYPFFVGETRVQPSGSASQGSTPEVNSTTSSGSPTRYNLSKLQTELGLLAQVVPGQKDIKLELGSHNLHETTVQSNPAWWYEGTWDSLGNWISSDGWVNLIWEQKGILFQITAQHLTTTELIKIAQSLP